MKRTGDLFEDLSAELGCIYISDLRLPPYREIACQSLISGQFSGYPVSMWRDMLNYLDVESSAEVENEEQAKSTLSYDQTLYEKHLEHKKTRSVSCIQGGF